LYEKSQKIVLLMKMFVTQKPKEASADHRRETGRECTNKSKWLEWLELPSKILQQISSTLTFFFLYFITLFYLF